MFQLFQFLGVGLIQSPRLTSSLLFKGTGVKISTGLPAFLISSTGIKTSPRTYQLFFISKSWAKNIHWMFQLFPISGSWADTVSQTACSFFFLKAGLNTSTGRVYSSIKLLKTSSIMFHSSSESSGIGCNSPSVPSSFSMNE